MMKIFETKIRWKTENTNRLIFCLAMVGAAFMTMSFFGVTPVSARTYATDADFDEGVLVGVEHETVPDQLQLSKEAVALPFIWVPNQGQGTVSKVNTETGDEIGRYRVAPHSNCSPSRTTVDLGGSCWVGLREAGTVVKIGLFEAGQYIDRNGDGTIKTSQDRNNDGDITGRELLPWGQDECVLYEVVLIPGKEGTYAPGTYSGEYEGNEWGQASPRGLAIDASNNLWVGTWESKKYYYIDGLTGAILKTVNTDWPAYGAVIDGNGILWSSTQAHWRVLRLDPKTDTVSTLNMDHFVYGIGLDYLGHLFVSGWDQKRLSRVDISTVTPTINWTQDKLETDQARGVACTSDNDVWVACTGPGKVYRYDNNGNLKATIDVGSPTGVAVDIAGKVWSCNLEDDYIKRIDPATNTIDLSKRIVDSGGHYSYSDMTGVVLRTTIKRIADLMSEALDTSLRFATGGSAGWFGQSATYNYDGDAAQSGDISDDQESWMLTTISGKGTVQFIWMVSSEEEYDCLEFYIDGALQDKISGLVEDWEQMTYTISTSGSHVLEWRYMKDSVTDEGSDCGWVDKVEWLNTP